MDSMNKGNGLTHFEKIFQASKEGIIIADADSCILRINPFFQTLLGYETDELKGKPFIEIVHKKAEIQRMSSYTKLYHFQRSSKSPIEMELIDKHNHPVAVRLRSELIKDSAGEVIEAIGIVEDFRKGKEEFLLVQKVQETQEILHNVLAHSADAIVICDTNGYITHVNEALLQMVRYQEHELVGKHVVELSPFDGDFTSTTGEHVTITEEYHTNNAKRADELFEKGSVPYYQIYLIRNDKVVIPVEVTLSLLKDPHGERAGSIAICRDITERIKAERNIKEAKEFLEDIIKTSVDGIMVTDNAGFITMVNNAMVTMLGYTADEFVGKRPKDFFPNTNAYEEKNKALLTTLMEYGVVTNFKSILIRKDGKPVHSELNIALQKDHHGTITGSVASIRDITDRVRSEEELIRIKDSLAEIIESSLDSIVVSNSIGQITKVNKAFLTMIGFKEEEVLGKTMMNFSPHTVGTFESTTGELITIDEEYIT